MSLGAGLCLRTLSASSGQVSHYSIGREFARLLNVVIHIYTYVKPHLTSTARSMPFLTCPCLLPNTVLAPNRLSVEGVG